MPVSDLDNITGSYLLNSGNYAFDQIIDASIHANNLALKTGTAVFTTYDLIEAADFDNAFWFETVRSPLLPRSSLIAAIHFDFDGIDGSLSYVNTFFGREVAGDHEVTTYDQTIDPLGVTNRDKLIFVNNGTCYIFDGGGVNVTFLGTKNQWMIVTMVVETLPSKLRINRDGGAFTETVDATNSVVNTGNIMQVGNLGGALSALKHLAVGELHFFSGDVSQQSGYATVITELKTKYAI